jgi:hypothetical protein
MRGTTTIGSFSLVAAGLLATGSLAVAGSSAAAKGVSTSHPVNAVGGLTTAKRMGTVNLTALAAADAAHPAAVSTSNGSTHAAPLRLLHSNANALQHQAATTAGTLSTIVGNASGKVGFDGITAAINGSANSPEIGGIGDVTPPDQGLAVGTGPAPNPTVIVEFVNDTLNIYAPNGHTLLGAVPSFQVFGLTPSAFLSDPRAYWDPHSGHWFLTEFIFGDGKTAPLSTQFIAVSQTTSPFGSYAVFSIDTSDSGNTAGGCPCFGDFDQVGSDNSGFYIATNEFSVDGPNFNGSVIYAMSKGGLIAAANGGPVPALQRYAVPFTSDPFAAYHLSPSTVTQGSSNPNTEYFVESNANLNSGSSLEVYALLSTSKLNGGGRPKMVMTSVGTESYSSPPNAVQENGPTPLGTSLGFTGVPQLQTDFDAVQEVTYANGLLYAELSTGFNYGVGQNSGAAWFVLQPTASSSSIAVANDGNGYVETSQDMLYPVIGVNSHGLGYMAFAIAGDTRYPSAAYVTFSGTAGAGHTVYIAATGANPLDDFSCYPPFTNGQCRYGDYSMAQAYNGSIYMATEYVAPQPRDSQSNWGTRVWSAPAP